jgi:branched-chain amino acid transport system ATP-binding protein
MQPDKSNNSDVPESRQEASLRVADVTVKFGGLTALSKVNLEIHPGEVVGIIGPNGAGKTTLFNVLSGIVSPDAGSFYLDGMQQPWPKSHQMTKMGLARTLQGVGLFHELTVLENIMVAASNLQKSSFIKSLFGAGGRSEKVLRERAEEVMALLDISGYADRVTSSLPYPISKRVSIARSLVARPSTLLLDEPAGGLGNEDIVWINQLILELRKEMSILLVEHHMDVIMNVCDRIYVLNFGEIIAEGTPVQVQQNEAVIAAYLGNGTES